MPVLFAKNPDMPTDFSQVRASSIFNDQILPTAQRLESLASDYQLDLDNEGQQAAQRREQQVEKDDQTFREMAKQDDLDLGLGNASATSLFSEPETSGEDGLFSDPPETPDPETSSAGAKILTQKSGRVNPRSLEKFIGSEVARSPLAGFVPRDGARYGITQGTPAEWSRFFTGLAKLESGFKNSAKGDIGKFKGDSNGLFQLSPEDARNHRLKDSEFTKEELADPTTNTKAAIAIAARLMLQDGVIAEGKRGAARYWGPLRRGKNPAKTSY